MVNMPLFSSYFNSLKSRLIVSGLFMVIVLLPIVGLTISNAYQKHMNASVKNELVAYSYSILAVAEVEQGALMMPEALVENQFNTSESGLYALITSKANIPEQLWRSPSLLAFIIPHELSSPSIGQGHFYALEIDQQAHFVYSFSVSFNDDEQAYPMTLHIIKQQEDYLALMNEFRQQLWLGLLLLMAVLLLLQFIWMKWSLKPLTLLKKEIADIEQGKANLLNANYPDELKQVTEQLNVLLTTEQNQRMRYRNSLSDLAHSLKTPLAVLQGQLMSQTEDKRLQSQEQLDAMSLMIEHQLKRAQSAGQSSWHLGVEIKPLLSKLINSLNKIYRDKALNFQINATENATDKTTEKSIFKGDEVDLLEILGNILDNASKAANKNIHITLSHDDDLLQMVVEDDGVGINETEIDNILQRGTRADTYQKGHGIGLAIVRDLVDSYQGQLIIARSEKLGGAKFTLLFPR